MMKVDLLIKHGRVIDPENCLDDTVDVAVKDGRIFKVGNDLPLQAVESFDATGCLVTPGLIDAHVHCYEYATPLGINPDAACLSRGVTTVIDAGSSGASTFPGLRKYVIEPSKTRVRALLHIALHGLSFAGCAGWAPGGESDTLTVLDEDSCRKCIENNRDVIVGVKVRLATMICDDGANENEAYKRAMSVAAACQIPLMVHHSRSSVPTQRSKDAQYCCPGDMKTGDIYTHTFHAHDSTIVDVTSGKLHSDVIDARSRGVLFDVGHGAGAFSWPVAELAARQGFWPDLLGTDLHTENNNGPVYDLPTIMTKFLYMGMTVPEIIRSVTSSPARAYSLNDVTGSLTPGKDADITILKIESCDVMLEDVHGQCRRIKQRFVPVAVWRAGERFPITTPAPWPNPESQKRMSRAKNDCLIKDD